MAAPGQVMNRPKKLGLRDATAGAFFWLSAFYVVYSARPEDWLPGLKYIPMAKISAIFAIIGLVVGIGRTSRKIKDLPTESKYLLAMIVLLFAWAPLSPVWKGGAVLRTFEFSKVYVVWVLTFLLVTSLARLRRLIFIQAGSVAMVSVVSVVKGSSHPRLEGVLGGMYSNPNDLAFAIVLTLPLIFLLMLTSKNVIGKGIWSVSMLLMLYTLFRTASRAGFIDLVIAAPVALWFFGVKGRRPQLIVVTAVVGVLLLAVAGKHLRERFFAISGTNLETGLEGSAYGSYEERKFLMQKALSAIAHYPLTGIGTGDFPPYSEKWKTVHMTYLQIGSEGGIPVLILYVMFFYSGFRNLKKLNKNKNLDPEARLFMGAFYSSLVGFVVGACFAPEAYQFFPYFTIAYTSALLATVKASEAEGKAEVRVRDRTSFREGYANYERPGAVTIVR
jgi:hypothetical protein